VSNSEQDSPLPEYEAAFGDARLKRSRRNTKIVTVAVIGALAAASLLQIDVYATAAGRISPDRYLRSIDAPRTGRVSRLHARDGDQVTAGEPILEYDCAPGLEQAAAAKAQLAHLEREMRSQEQLAQSVVPGAGLARPGAGPASRDAALRTSLYQSTTQTAAQGVRRSEARIAGARARVDASKSELQLSRQNYDRVKELNSRGYATGAVLDQATAKLRQAQSETNLAQAELAEAMEATAQSRSEASSAVLDGQNSVLTRLSTVRAQVLELRTEVSKLEAELTDCVVEAPATGKLFWLDTLAPGTWLRSATPLSKVVPQDHAMIIEAQLPNQDIPFVRAGQRAIVKLTSLPHQRYGSLTGEVRFVAPDSTVDETGASFYKVEIVITSIPEEARRALPQLISGMDVQVNVVTDKRRLISYFLEPIILSIKESFHER